MNALKSNILFRFNNEIITSIYKLSMFAANSIE